MLFRKWVLYSAMTHIFQFIMYAIFKIPFNNSFSSALPFSTFQIVVFGAILLLQS